MKKAITITFFFIIFFFIAQCTGDTQDVIPDHHTSEISLDWDGTYTGMLPCADCEGIESTIRLNRDHTYVIERLYLGKSDEVFTKTGDFTWNEAGSTIILSNITDAPNSYFVGENHIVQLDIEGKRITGELAQMYVLRKKMPESMSAPLYGTRWILTELRGNAVNEPRDTSKVAHFMLDPDDRRVYGNGGCNGFFGTVTTEENDRIRFSDIASTLMACENSDTEWAFFEVLEMTDSYHLQGNTLQLFRARMAPLAVLIKSGS